MDVNQKSVLELIELIYAAATDSQHWDEALAGVGALAGSYTTVLSVHDMRSQRTLLNFHAGAEPETMRLYEAYYHLINPWLSTGAALVPGIVSGEAFVRPEQLHKTEFYNDFGKRCGIVHSAAGILSVDTSTLSYLSLNRGERASHFSDAELDAIRSVVPHLRCALNIARQFDYLQTWRDAWNKSVSGLVLICAGEVVDLNSAARRIVDSADGFSWNANTIWVRQNGQAIRLPDCLRKASSGAGFDLMRIDRPSAKRPYAISAIELPGSGLRSGKPVLMIIDDPDASPLDALDAMLRVVYRMTSAEIRLATHLMQGVGLTKTANKLGISRHTAKAQLRSIFTKTDTRTQSELVALILRSANRFT